MDAELLAVVEAHERTLAGEGRAQASRFCYDLATGECRNARGDRIRTERIE